MPTNKIGFASHSVFALSSQLGVHEVLAPDATTRICGMFKVKDGEKPIKRVKARKKVTPTGFQPLATYGVGTHNDGSEDFREKQIAVGSAPENDGMDDLFAFWQTEPWSPAFVGPDDKIPVNEYRNIELALLNPGLVHVDRPRIALVAKKLEIPYAPCLLGFEGHGGNRTPTIRGIVVHQHSVEILKEAYREYERHVLEQEHDESQRRILRRWKKLINGILLKDRLEREYGDDEQAEA
ncbi:mismatch repair [Fragilaria crotonensis]|nr:mismatch repair [Fragilaria crotonensis]